MFSRIADQGCLLQTRRVSSDQCPGEGREVMDGGHWNLRGADTAETIHNNRDYRMSSSTGGNKWIARITVQLTLDNILLGESRHAPPLRFCASLPDNRSVQTAEYDPLGIVDGGGVGANCLSRPLTGRH